MGFQGKVDFVVPWVDGADAAWQNQYREYVGDVGDDDLNGPERFRSNEGLLVQWIKGVNAYAKWVNKIFIIIDRLNLK